jgi:8-oxo-dGTP pyrophosphatase MutT (NUDIX family)
MDLSSHGIVALVRNKAGKFLLLEDSRDLMKGYWAPPHGRCEVTDESEALGVEREVKEETNLIVRPIKKVHSQPADTKVKTVSFWVVECEDGKPILNEESSSYGWFSVDEALSINLYPGTKSFFEKVKAGKVLL